MKPVYLALAAALFLLSPAHAQQASQGRLRVHAGASLPQGNFGATDASQEESGFAALGGAVVGEYVYPLSTSGLEVVGSISAMGNKLDLEASIDEEAEEDIEQFEEEGGDFNTSSGYWINVPLMAGLQYKAEASPTIDVYGLGKAGVNFAKRPDTEVEAEREGASLTIEESSSWVNSLGLSLGAGAVFNDQINVSLRYLNLGTPEITSEGEVNVSREGFDDESRETEIDYDQPLSAIQVMVGITL
jgi:hypothetical protein